MTTIAMLGSGMAGWGAAHRLAQDGIRPVMCDKSPHCGGHAASFRFEGGFRFDPRPHISFTMVERMRPLLAEQVDHRYEALPSHLNNYWQGHWPTHPVQLHLHGLPEDLVVKVIADFVAEQRRGERPIANCADWLLASFGRLFAELFPMRHTREYHTTPAENLSADRLGSRVYRTSLGEVLRGAGIQGAPDDMREAADGLACSTCALVNLGVDRPEFSRAHMTYVYDADVAFSHVSFPHMLSATNCPPGTGSIQVEVHFSREYRPLTSAPELLIDPVISDLKRTGVLRDEDRILFQDAMVIPYANVIFDLDRARALATVHGYLDEVGIGYCGRYVEWGYMWTDESFLSGERAAEAALACCH